MTSSIDLVIFGFFQEALSSQRHLVTHHVVDKLHSDWLRRLRYYHSNDMLMSCSGNSRDSLIMRGVMKKAHDKIYVFKVSKVNIISISFARRTWH
jgi:hypothetical protein